MKPYISFSMRELKQVRKALQTIASSVGAKFEHETTRLLKTISSKQANHSLRLKMENLERLSSELHELEVRYGINLGQTIYRFLHSFHRN